MSTEEHIEYSSGLELATSNIAEKKLFVAENDEALDISSNQTFKKKRLVHMLGKLPDLPLPDGWIGVNHESGGIVYLHKETRVVTWSRPYHIGTGSLRKHDVPVAAIPCLHQSLGLSDRKNLVKRKRDGDAESQSSFEKRFKTSVSDLEDYHIEKENEAGGKENCPTESVDQSTSVINENQMQNLAATLNQQEDEMINSDDIHPQTVNDISMPHNSVLSSYQDSRSDTEDEAPVSNDSYDSSKTLSRSCKMKNEPSLGSSLHNLESELKIEEIKNLEMVNPDEFHRYLGRIFSFKELTDDEARIPIFGEGNKEEDARELPEALKTIPYTAVNKNKSNNAFTFTAGKTPLALLNEYCRNKLKKPLQMFDAPGEGDEFIVDAVIGDLKYGRGEGKSKKAAKQNAARRSLEILLPKQFGEISDFEFTGKEFAVFDELAIDDPSVADSVRSVGLPFPAEVLSMCLKRNRGLSNANIIFKLIASEKGSLHKYEIECGKHTASGQCKNRKTGQQLASQAILKKIHPKLEKWGQLVRMYCRNPKGLIRNSKKLEREKEFDELPQAKTDLMNKLKMEMRQLERTQKIASSTLSSSNFLPTIPSAELDLDLNNRGNDQLDAEAFSFEEKSL